MGNSPSSRPALSPEHGRTRLSPTFPHLASRPQGPRELSKFEFIDSLRGWAFVGVLCCHVTYGTTGLPIHVGRTLANGGFGVQLFFVLSALTLFLSLDARKKVEVRPTANFFIRRFFRIAPLFYAAAVFYPWCFPGHRFEPTSPRDLTIGSWVSTLTFTNGWSPSWINQLVPGGWSIAVEMTFYLFVPFLHRSLRTIDRTLWAAFVALLVGGTASLALKKLLIYSYGAAYEPNIQAFAFWWFPNQVPAFFLGILLYLLVRDHLGKPDPRLYFRSLLMLIAAGYFFLAVSLSGHLALFLKIPCFGVPIVLLAGSLALHPHRLLVNPVLSYIGKVSFSAYITHFAVLLSAVKFFEAYYPAFNGFSAAIRFAALMAITLAGTVLVASVTYQSIELPGQAVGKRLIAMLEGTSIEAHRLMPRWARKLAASET
jgi:peptidoglycan/LPS O-acetylase OafA/YrhL